MYSSSYTQQQLPYPHGYQQQPYPGSSENRQPTYSPGAREASSTPPSAYNGSAPPPPPPPPPHLPPFAGYPTYQDPRSDPSVSGGSDPYSSYRNQAASYLPPPPQPNNPQSYQRPIPHPYNPSQTSLESFGPHQVYNQLGNLLEQPFTDHSAAGFRRPSSPRSFRPPLVSHHHSSSYSSVPQQRERSSNSSSESSASAQTPQHQPYHSFPPPSFNNASPDFDGDQPPSTFPPNPNHFQPKGFANAPTSKSRGSVSSSSTASNGTTPLPFHDRPTPFASSSSTVQPSSSSSGPQSKKKRTLFPSQPFAHCSDCSQPIARLYLRGEKESFDVQWEGWWSCKSCLDKNGKGKAKEDGSARRKRNRETQDIEAPLICDVCMKEKGQGGIVAKDSKASIDFSVEFVCVSCDSKYQRCTDCGGGGGGRVGIGKWRCKELFLQGRKTCSLAHTRIGAAPLELGVWEISELNSLGVTEEVVRHCERMWMDRTLARMAVPDVLEVESINREGVQKVKRSFQDIQTTLGRGWPSRDHVTGTKEPTELNVSRRYLGLTWVKTRSRRGTAADTDGAEEDEAKETGHHEYREGALANIKKVSGDFPQVKPLVIPPGSELVGLWVGDWNMLNGTLLISTSLPFEGSDGDDRSALTVGEIACRIVLEIDEINSQRLSVSSSSGASSSSINPPLLLPPLEHLWVISDGTSSAIRDRMQDILSRRRQFLPLDEYLERHTNVRPEIFQDFPGPKGGDSWADSGGGGAPAQVLVRWLGPHFDRQRLEELAGSEFGKKLKSKKKK
ncbi:hypothetical protein BDY24DRAFT_391298 [Mrakia frigida]|uniref:uncharacterized protein n=1 Tax=Mrakia frigida TaxID=29902 RepID=UPI003FCC2166